MASLIKAIKNMIRGKKDSVAESMSDPVNDGKYAIEDSEREIGEFTAKIAKLMAETKRLAKEKEQAEGEATKYHDIAKKAAESGAEDDVRKAVSMKKQAEERVTTLDAELVKNEQLTNRLRDQLNKARAKVANAKSNLARLSARMEGAKVRQDLAKASTKFNTSESPLASLDDLEKTVNSQEAKAEAWEELAETDKEAEVEELEVKYGEDKNADIDAEVAKMMAAAAKKKK